MPVEGQSAEQIDEPRVLPHQCIDPRRLPVEENGDGTLLAEGWCGRPDRFDRFNGETRLCR